jgi:hypothetical protein
VQTKKARVDLASLSFGTHSFDDDTYRK